MEKQLLAFALASCFSPLMVSTLSPPAQASPAAVQGAIAACAANPEACTVIGVMAGTWVLWQNAPKVFCTYSTCQQSRGGEFRSQDRPPPGRSGKYAETGKLVTKREGCQDMEKRFRQGGFKLRFIRYELNRARGSSYPIYCIFGGDSEEIARFHKYWR